MVQTQAEAPPELQTGPEGGQAVVSDGHDAAAMLRTAFESVKSFLTDSTGTKSDKMSITASQIVNGNAPFDNVMQNLTDIKGQGRLNEFSTKFESNYSVGLRDQLVQNYPGREADIDKVLGTTADPSDRKLGGLTRQELSDIYNNFPALKGVISSPDVLGAMIQNEKDHTYGRSDSFIDGAFRRLHKAFGDSTQFFSDLKPDELRAKAQEGGGIAGYFKGKFADFQERILRVSMGDGQVQIRNILALQGQEREANRDVPTIESSLTPKGSANLVAAYFTKSIDVLSKQNALDPKENPFLDTSRPAVVRGFAEAQEMWNEGKRTNNQALLERAVMMTYNAGIPNSDPTKWNPEHILRHYLDRK